MSTTSNQNVPRRRKRRVKIIILATILVILAALFAFGPGEIEKRMNRTFFTPPYNLAESARQHHGTLLVADLHADSLLWGRDLLKRGSLGHVDVPRLQEGNVALQVFSIVTKTPRDLNRVRNDAASDNITLLAVLQLWPPATWNSLKQRALYQAGRLRDAAARSGGSLTLIRTAADLSTFGQKRLGDRKLVGAILSLEGAHALEGKISNLDDLFDSGVRIVAPAHFFDNEFGGSSSGAQKTGLTELGKQMIKRMEDKQIILDLAHASPQTIVDALAIATRPVIVSHTGARGTCDNNRNLTDDEMRGVARTGGVVGIGYWPTATCGDDTAAIARAIVYAIGVVGVEHVALGSDFDGATFVPFDTTGIAKITQALMEAGLNQREIELVMGANVWRLFAENLPK